MKRLRWFLGLGFILAVFALILFWPLPTLIGWQSKLLHRVFMIMLFSGGFCFLRIALGPTAADRVAALDIFGILILGFCAILGIPTGREWYIDIGIAWALQSFISILAMAKFMEGRNFDE
ncbi:MAG: monovalent cation/H+ antiporter complex subunit F [Candidatus Omnitrophica bacterium]|nr:monovalent cation/H+ antiporter complex subunit F [Candidatus Omnitrophota bacterium]